MESNGITSILHYVRNGYHVSEVNTGATCMQTRTKLHSQHILKEGWFNMTY